METKEQTELDLKELAAILWKRKSLIALITMVAVLLSGIISYFILTPQYEASAQILVNKNDQTGEFDRADIQTNVELINTYSVVMTSPRILEEVIEDYDLDKTVEQLKEQMTVNNVENSQVMSISVTDPNYEQAIYMTNAIAETFKNEIVDIMNVDNVHIMAAAQPAPDPTPVSPKPLLNMAIAFVVGLMTAVGLAFLLEYLDNTMKTEEDVQNLIGLPVLGTIAQMDNGEKKKASKPLRRSVRGSHLEA